MAERVPRRMKRFYRQQDQPQTDNENYSSENYSEKEDYLNTESHLPSMDYEDLEIDEKNYQEIKKIEQMNLEEKLTLLEVQKFKKEKKRLPNKEEAEQIADNLYTQFKNSEETATKEESPRSSRERRRRERTKHEKNEESADIPEEINVPQEPINTNANIKDLFSDTETIGKKKKGDDFDLGIDLDASEENDDLDELKEIKTLTGDECPNCEQEHEKTIYCSSCGTAYCEKCAKGKDANGYACPKCGTKNKA